MFNPSCEVGVKTGITVCLSCEEVVIIPLADCKRERVRFLVKNAAGICLAWFFNSRGIIIDRLSFQLRKIRRSGGTVEFLGCLLSQQGG